ncbi:hypothetical protein ABZZ74_46820 [Streptomyces sp. NPDC006476]|uniref:hypothetical protein n=1 Tax=Streptomyces sp. NPDC006476 TaxID=3157175 RepID=UPI0033BA0F9F
MHTWPLRRWLAAAAVTVPAALAIGVPTGVIPTPFYTRMTPVLWWNYPVWAISSILEGLLIATYVRMRSMAIDTQIGGPPAPVGCSASANEAPAHDGTNPSALFQGPTPPQEATERPRTARAVIAGVASAFAVGCPICNKLVVLAIGVSGALSYWAPVQPVLGVATVALLGYALFRRLRTATGCPVPS